MRVIVRNYVWTRCSKSLAGFVRFSLTPALSRWERENRVQAHKNSHTGVCRKVVGNLGTDAGCSLYSENGRSGES